VNPETTNTTICEICRIEIYRSEVLPDTWFHAAMPGTGVPSHAALPGSLPDDLSPAAVERWLNT